MSKTKIIAFDLINSYLAKSIPSFSIGSSDCLIPAVSDTTNCCPDNIIYVYIKSLVVPAMGLVIETLLSANKLISVDFPAFGGPQIRILFPSLIVSPLLEF